MADPLYFERELKKHIKSALGIKPHEHEDMSFNILLNQASAYSFQCVKGADDVARMNLNRQLNETVASFMNANKKTASESEIKSIVLGIKDFALKNKSSANAFYDLTHSKSGTYIG